MTSEPQETKSKAAPAPVKQVLVEEPVTQKPDVPGEKPQTFRFDDWALI